MITLTIEHTGEFHSIHEKKCELNKEEIEYYYELETGKVLVHMKSGAQVVAVITYTKFKKLFTVA